MSIYKVIHLFLFLLARVFTTAVEVGDTMIVLNFLISAILNSIIVVQCVYYSNKINTKVH